MNKDKYFKSQNLSSQYHYMQNNYGITIKKAPLHALNYRFNRLTHLTLHEQINYRGMREYEFNALCWHSVRTLPNRSQRKHGLTISYNDRTIKK